MPSNRRPSDPRAPNQAEPIPDRLIDIDDAAIDESAVVDPDEDLGELANPSDDADQDSRREGDWRERDANRRTHGEDDLKA